MQEWVDGEVQARKEKEEREAEKRRSSLRKKEMAAMGGGGLGMGVVGGQRLAPIYPSLGLGSGKIVGMPVVSDSGMSSPPKTPVTPSPAYSAVGGGEK